MVSLLHEVGSLCTRSCCSAAARSRHRHYIVSTSDPPFHYVCPNRKGHSETRWIMTLFHICLCHFIAPTLSSSSSSTSASPSIPSRCHRAGIVSVQQNLKATAVVGWKFSAGIERQSKWHGQEKTKELSPFLPMHHTSIQTTAIHITVYRCMFPSSSLHH